jgi:hypothetical protein
MAGDGEMRYQSCVLEIEEQGMDPVAFTVEKVKESDLLIFDDALHTAVEPFEFYQQLIRTPEFVAQVKYVFLELLPVNRQSDLDAYFAAEKEKPELLYRAFQDATSYGFPYRTYFDLLHTIYEVNEKLPEARRIRVVGVNSPVYWSDIDSRRDMEQFRKGMLGRDNSMYQIILSELDGFRSGRKGMFLTNTRHAYTGIRNSDGEYYWNSGTFFRQWHPGRTHSIRLHNLILIIEEQVDVADSEKTTEGMESMVYRWGRVDDGIWDSAFAAAGNRPVAIPLTGTAFGEAPYLGNHMTNVLPGQTMADAYDSVIFLAPLEKLRKTAMIDDIYTPSFRNEMTRRYRAMMTPERLSERVRAEGVTSVEALVDKDCVAEPEQILPQVDGLDPVDAWKSSD